MLILSAYFPAISGEYLHWDDGKHFINNPLVYGNLADNLLNILRHFINGTYIPLTTVSFNIEYHIFGLSPAISHIINILLHAGNTLLIYHFLQLLGLTASTSFIASAFFGVHPMHVESIAWVTERKDVLYSFFYLNSLIAYVRYLTSLKQRSLVISLIFALLSILAKPMAVSLPLILCLLDWWFKRPFNATLLKEKLPFIAIIGAIASLTFFKLSPHPSLIFPDSALIAIWSLMFYIIKFFIPFPLLPLYLPPEPVSFTNPTYFISVASALGSIILTFLLRHNRWIVFAFFWWFFSLFFFTRMDFADINIVADRFMYLPSIGFCALVALGLHWLYQRRLKTISLILTTCLIASLGWLSFNQTIHWQSDHQLWRLVLTHEPKNTLARKKISHLLYSRQQPAFDYDKFQHIIDNAPDKAKAYNERGLMLIEAGQQELALQDFQRAIELNPMNAQGYNNRGSFYDWGGDSKRALINFNKAITLAPQEPTGYINRAIIYTKKHQFQDALNDCNYALKINPSFKEAYFRRAIVYRQLNIWPNAINDLTETLRLDPQHKDSYYQRALIYKHLNLYKEAIQDLEMVISINPSDTQAMNDLGVLHLMVGNLPKALTTFNQAIILDEYNHELYVNRANTWLHMQRFDNALIDLTQAISLSHQPWKYLITRGDILMTQGSFKQATQDFKDAHQWAPQETLPLFKLARAYFEQTDYAKSLASLNQAIKRDAADLNLYLARAQVYRRMNQPALAANDEHHAHTLEQPGHIPTLLK